MKPTENLADCDKWEAVVRSDKSFDGLFVYAVKTTGIFCRPSCKAKPPARKNVLFFAVAADAFAAGFRPCKLCRPDMAALRTKHGVGATGCGAALPNR